ncbi:MAG: hypothetical protein M1383_03745 [Patescibacteria group bacterium]|nr:hypothetical protein [Patescibacteria group bacterium]
MAEEITLKAIEELLDVKLEEKLDFKLEPLKQTLEQHTIILDQIAKQTKDWNIEMSVMRARMEKYEKAIKLVGEKLNLDLKAILE